MRNSGESASSFVEIRPEDITWTENLISIILPSDATELTGLTIPTSGKEAAGTGRVTLTDNTNTITSDQIVTVEYAIANVRYPIPSMQARMKHQDSNNSGGYTWRIHENMSTLDTNARSCIEQALCDFNQACGIKYNLDGVDHSGVVVNGNDGVNVIGFVSDDSSFAALGETYYKGILEACFDAASIARLFITEIDIRIKSSGIIDWDFDCGRTNMINEGRYDLFSVMKHEFGHSLTLEHFLKLPEDPLNDIGSQPLMYYVDVVGGVNNSIDAADQNALDNVMNFNTTSAWGGQCPDEISQEYFNDCDVLNSSREHIFSNEYNPLNIFPNPTKADMRIELKSENGTEYIERIEVYTMTGQRLATFDTNGTRNYFTQLDLSFIGQSQLLLLKILTNKQEYNEIISFIR